GARAVSHSLDRLLPGGTTIPAVNWLEPSSVTKCVRARQVNRGTGADGISDPAGNVSVRLRVHALARVHDGLTLMRPAPSAIDQSQLLAFCSHRMSCWLKLFYACKS